jgi:hypothetical protein
MDRLDMDRLVNDVAAVSLAGRQHPVGFHMTWAPIQA